MAFDRHKRTSALPALVCAEDKDDTERVCGSRPFPISLSEFGCCANRFTRDSLRRGGITLESLFEKYMKEPLRPLSPRELARSARISALLAEFILATGDSAFELEQEALLEGLETLKSMQWRVKDEGKREKVSA